MAGLLALDLLINLPGFSSASPVSSLLAPSVDLLLAAAGLMGAATAGPGLRLGLRITVCVCLVCLIVYATGVRLGLDIAFRLVGGHSAARLAAGWARVLAAVGAAAILTWLISRLVISGFSHVIIRSAFLATVALLTILQVVTGRHIFMPSVIPRLAGDIASALR